jgi:hypothetical protein
MTREAVNPKNSERTIPATAKIIIAKDRFFLNHEEHASDEEDFWLDQTLFLWAFHAVPGDGV